MTAPQAIMDLIELFDRNVESYRSGKYNETQVRLQFINPFFKALGWDVYNEEKNAEAYKDVFHEDAVKVGGSTKAPDYSFRIGGTRKFFVEAKKPSVNLKDDIGPAFQLRRYSWSAKLPLGILTDFDELAVYDGRIQPSKTDKASVARVKYFTYKEYVDRWDEIASIFSKDEILKGSFDKYAESTKGKRGTAGVDNAFLQEIEIWRDLLARNIALRNPDLSTRELNFSVQRTIDRIVFLRICEDRGIERYGWLQSLLEGARVYPRLCEFFRRADERYNAGLFHFGKDSDRLEPPDELTLSLEIDDKPLKEIIKSIYYPDSPYEFSVLPPEILGQVYEQFLGKVISVSPGRRVNVDYKPEVRKAGGVYYTPSYIVEYIVDNTVGKLLEGQTPSTAAELRVLDPACGSGSFLIGAYQKLLDWHRDWYVEKLVPLLNEGKTPASKEVLALLPAGYTGPNKKRGKKKEANRDQSPEFPIFEAKGGEWKLTTRERRRILLNNIYGVDIDSQAVEVTKLSLHLKVLEGENEETLSKQLKLFQERALPYLGRNIKCGNSLIGPDFYGGQTSLFDEEVIYRVNAFDWEGEFPDIMGRGGFDAVIGNPPYVRQEGLGEFKAYFQEHYQVYHGIADLYTYFIEKGVSLLRPKGIFSYIVANKWMRANYGLPLRVWLKGQHIEEIVDFGDLQVFQNATTYPCIIRITKEAPHDVFDATEMETLDFGNLKDYVDEHHFQVKLSDLDDSGWSLVDESAKRLLEKLRRAGTPLGEYVGGKIYRGVLTGLNEAFVIDEETRTRLIREDPKSSELIKPFLAGRDIKRYQTPNSDKYLILMPRGWTREKSNNTKDALGWLKQNYPAVAGYLMPFTEAAQKRYDKGEYWWELRACDYYAEFEKPKIIVPAIVRSASYAFDVTAFYSNDKTSIIPTDDLYLLSILNSKVADYVIHSISSTKRGGYFEYKPMYVQQIPIRTIDFSDPADVARHDKMVSLVERMLDLHKRLAETKIAHEKTLLHRQIEATDKQIDALVYELYGLTDEEIRIVEVLKR